MAAAYRVVVSSVSCYNSVVVDRRAHSHAVHYCCGPCGALSQGLDCTVAHRSTCSELLVAPDPPYNDFSMSPIHSSNSITHQLPNHGKLCVSMGANHNGGMESGSSSGNLSLGEDSPTWRGKKTSNSGGSTGNLSSFSSLKDITEEAINLASGKLKEFSFDKLRLSSSSHVTLRKGRKVRPDSFSRRSTDLEIIYGHFSPNSMTNATTHSMSNGLAGCNNENMPPYMLGKGTGVEESKIKASTATLSAVTKSSGSSIGSLSRSGSLDQSLNTVASLYRTTLGEENLIARLLEKTRAEAASGGGEDIRACLDILLKCSEDLKKCTDIIKQCIRRKAGGGSEEGGASPDSVYRAVMTRLSSYLKKLPLELEGLGSLGGSGQGVQGTSGNGPTDLAELVNTLHSIQQGPFSPIFGNEQPPRYEDVVQSPPISKAITASTLPTSVQSEPTHKITVQSSTQPKDPPFVNGLHQLPPSSVMQNTLMPPLITCSPCNSSPSHSPLRSSPIPTSTQTPPASPMEALFIEEEEAELGKASEHVLQQTHPLTKGLDNGQLQNGKTLGLLHQSQPYPTFHASHNIQTVSGQPPAWPQASPVAGTKKPSHQNDDIDKLLMDLENLSQSMSHPRNTEPPLPAKTRKREGNKSVTSESFSQPSIPQFQTPKTIINPNTNGLTSTAPQNATPPQRGSSESVAGEEEDGALLLRILESIESFAQELVESGAGSTGSAERQCGKEKEVMRLLQDTLVPTGRDTPTEMFNSGSTSTTQFIPATTAVTHTPTEVPTTIVFEERRRSASETMGAPDASMLDTLENIGEVSTSKLPADPSGAADSYPILHTDEATPAAVPEVPVPDVAPSEDLRKDAVASVDEAVAAKGANTTLLIQQTPEVIQVQHKPEKKPGTPPPAPAASPAPTLTPVPAPRSPSPPPAPVTDAPPPPAINIPRFYYPRGLPAIGPAANHDATIAAIKAAFAELEEEKADIYEMGKLAKVCGCPLYWKAPMFYAAGGERTDFVSVHSFVTTWRKLLHSCHDDASRFINLLAKPGCNYLEQEDLIPLLQDIVDTHPGLTFLKDAPEFHSRYITTVIQRIFYVVNRSWTGRITMMELRRSNFLQTLALLEEEEDINQITDYFSYEHFYVIYCKFWELDTDHDLYIDPKDLGRYNDHASSNRITDRLFSGAVTRGNAVQREGRMSYAEFVWFLLSEEDKKNPTSIEYWFRCMDLDGDGVLSMFELEYFYEEQCERMERMGIEPLPFQDLLCQMLDLVKPESTGKITLSDLKRCRMAHIFYDTFFNLEKYLDHEQRDPFAVQKDVESEGPEPSDWDKYAAEEYEILVAEETANEQLHEGSFDDDYESEELQVSGEMGNKIEKLVIADLSA